MPVQVNDIHSRLTATTVCEIFHVTDPQNLEAALSQARQRGVSLSICGGRHAMGAQPFCTDGLLIDTTSMNRVLSLDEATGVLEVEAGIQWPELVSACRSSRWGIVQKPTGTDTITLGGSLSANIHGRGLAFAPIVQDVLSFRLLTPQGEWLTVSREENADWFGRVIGGYGLFGLIYSVRLQLAPRQVVQRKVQVIPIDQAIPVLEASRDAGALYGDFQFAINPDSPQFLTEGIVSVYQPAPPGTALPSTQTTLSTGQWQQLVAWAHSDKQRAYDAYVQHYLTTDGQLY
jgi:FAD/FMN-containing dehydrogenase